MINHYWVDISRDNDTQVETIRAHFEGHAYDAHWHDSYLIGVTEAGIQQFHSGKIKYRSTPGKVFALEPGDVHDGDAIDRAGFTYRMLYIPPGLFHQALPAIFDQAPDRFEMSFPATLIDDRQLATVTLAAFDALHFQELKIVRDYRIQQLILSLTRRFPWRKKPGPEGHKTPAVHRVRDYLHDMMSEDIGLTELAAVAGMDRFRLSREFAATFGLPPHAYLVQLRLARSRRLLSLGVSPADVAALTGFADQSHLGRWFRRAYQMTPAAYRQICTNVPDR
ncbi:AraC family transcriptional regulator [Acerihabitans arboris]|uniref:Helix-turn-helix domain-containing protein n=1 Tax=Acerihabitans arboris TaxID=2691583 RepID=A0A845SP75_9GAMM|nr:AraC family transcriptional regulator [Acerihabitans arboris]NDL64746.1 helix-turn-helix domain-containing protein [Acerihabitans arboris]